MMPYCYNVGNVVQTARTAPWRDVVWRGRQWVPGPGGQPWQVNVYRLRGPYWDCYYEYQLHPARP